MRRALSGAVLGALLAPAGARAGVAEVVQLDPTATAIEVRYTAATGERNTVRSARDGDVWIVRDRTAAVTVGTGCVAIDEHAARCTYAALRVATGDGDDGVTIDGDARATVDGGPGDDVLRGGERADTLDGGAGADLMLGGPGADVLISDSLGDRALGGPGGDALLARPRRAGALGATLDGGPGNDRIEFSGLPLKLAYTIAAGRRQTLRLVLSPGRRALLDGDRGAQVSVDLRAAGIGVPPAVLRTRWRVRVG